MQMAETRLVDPAILHVLPGRLRVRLTPWPRLDAPAIEQRLRRVEGVAAATANPLTQTVLVRFDPAQTSTEHVLAAVRALCLAAITWPASDALSSDARVPVSLPAAGASVVPATSISDLPLGLVPLDDVMRWANETIARSDTAPAAHPTPVPGVPSAWMRWLLSVLRRLDSASFALKALTAVAGMLCAASPLALLLSAVEVVQLLLELHVRLVA